MVPLITTPAVAQSAVAAAGARVPVVPKVKGASTVLSSCTVAGNVVVDATIKEGTMGPVCAASSMENSPRVTVLGPLARGPRWSESWNEPPVMPVPRAADISVAAGAVIVGSTKTAGSVLMHPSKGAARSRARKRTPRG